MGIQTYSSWHASTHSQEEHIMDPATVFCPNRHCHARGQTGMGNIAIHSQKEQRFICHACHKTFSATTGTIFYRLRTSAETVVIVVTLLAHGCPVQAIVAAFGLDERTIAGWWARSGRQGQAVHAYLVEQPRDLGQVQADELRVKKQGGIVWMALAIMVKTRLWLGGEVSEQRDMTLIRQLIERVRRCAGRWHATPGRCTRACSWWARCITFAHLMRVCPIRSRRPLPWRRGSRTIAGRCTNCCRFMCRCLAGHHRSGVDVMHGHCNA